MPADVCQTCGRPLPRPSGKRGRASVYCSAACRQRAYRARQAPAGDAVHDLISDIGQRVQRLSPQLPGAFYEDVTELSSSVGRLRRIAKVAVDAAQSADAGDEVRSSDEWDFAAMVEPHRKEIQIHCYQMVGSYDDSEDLVQETFLRAWRHREGFEGRASLRAWLYKIATNACLDFLRRNQRRPQKYDPLPGFDHGSGEPPDRFNWLQPYPDELLAEAEAQPESAAVSNETLELVFLAAIQHLPPRQRAVLIMRDALGWQAAETARALDMSVASVNSALQRARPAMREHLPERRSDWSASVTATDEERELLRRYMEAAMNADVNAMAGMLSADVKLTMPPNPYWFLGRDAVINFVTPVFDTNSPAYHGRWRHLPTRANRQPALGGYVQRVGTAVYRAQVLDVLRVVDGRIVEITSFEPHLFPAFGLPLTLPR